MQLPGPNEAQTELISQDAADQGLADIGVILLLDGLSYQLHIQDVFTFFLQSAGHFADGFQLSDAELRLFYCTS